MPLRAALHVLHCVHTHTHAHTFHGTAAPAVANARPRAVHGALYFLACSAWYCLIS